MPTRYLTYPNVMSTLAVFVALGGTSLAASSSTPPAQTTGPTTVLAPPATDRRSDATVYAFGHKRRAAIAQQGSDGPNPGSGAVEVTDGGGGRTSKLAHYQYGTTLWST